MRGVVLAATLVLLAIPGAHACSLVNLPVLQPSFHDDGLWYADTGALRHVDVIADQAVVSGYFVSYARLDDGRLLVAWQTGLGADCSGQNQVELRAADGSVLWSQGTGGIIRAHPDGPFVRMGGGYEDGEHQPVEFWRLDGDALVPWGAGRTSSQWFGWSADGPIEADDGGVYLGDRFVDTDEALDVRAAASHGDTVAILQQSHDSTRLTVVGPTEQESFTWPIDDSSWLAGVAWTLDGWLVNGAGRAFLVSGGEVVDLGLADVAEVAARNGDPVVFTGQSSVLRYTVFDGTRPTEAWERKDGLWAPVAAKADDGGPVDASRTGGSAPAPQPGHGGGGKGDGDKVWTVPGPALPLALLALGAAAVLRRR